MFFLSWKGRSVYLYPGIPRRRWIRYAQPRWGVLYSRVEYVTRTLATRCIFDVHTEEKKGGDEHLASYLLTYLLRPLHRVGCDAG